MSGWREVFFWVYISLAPILIWLGARGFGEYDDRGPGGW